MKKSKKPKVKKLTREETDDSHLSDEEYFAQFDTTTLSKEAEDRIRRTGHIGVRRVR
ncbi:MAG: hypothetical protein OXF66_01355 [Gammaproteobacteria bacterium]|nr:hypothetical protein [Gammaproteobacteria bacterium]MCY4341301.1 hypothetical protein [Gammaproteobacteria bacterium]